MENPALLQLVPFFTIERSPGQSPWLPHARTHTQAKYIKRLLFSLLQKVRGSIQFPRTKRCFTRVQKEIGVSRWEKYPLSRHFYFKHDLALSVPQQRRQWNVKNFSVLLFSSLKRGQTWHHFAFDVKDAKKTFVYLLWSTAILSTIVGRMVQRIEEMLGHWLCLLL